MAEHKGFFDRAGPFALVFLAEHIGAEIAEGADRERLILDVKALRDAGPHDLSVFDNPKYLETLATTRAGACLISPIYMEGIPVSTTPLLSFAPYRAVAKAMQLFYADALEPEAATTAARADNCLVHPSAELETGVRIEPGALVAREARLGAGTIVAAGALVGYRVWVGRGCYIGPGATVMHTIVGDRVIIHAGARIGHDRCGFALGPTGHLQMPQVGRVMIGSDVEIGANTTIDRGTLGDTCIGEGSKIGNLAQIGSNVVVGPHCVIVAQSGIAGSAHLDEFVIMGARSGVVGYIRAGTGAQIAGITHVKDDMTREYAWEARPRRPLGNGHGRSRH